MSENRKISIIVPIYNTENYIKTAIDSIINQTIGFENLEVICVNDASSDSSGKIIDDFAKEYDNITAIHLTKNSGFAGKPRNVGLDKASSKYVMFLDSDDYFSETACEVLYNKISSDSSLDIVLGGYTNILTDGYEEKNFKLAYKDEEELYYDNTTNSLDLVRLNPAISAKIYRKDMLEKNNISFKEDIPAQDLVFVLEAIFASNKIVSLNRFNVYNRLVRQSKKDVKSVTKNVNKDYLKGLLKAYSLTLDICEKYNLNKFLITYVLTNHFSFFLNQIKELDSSIIKEIFDSIEFKEFRNKEFFKDNKEFDLVFNNVDSGLYDNIDLLKFIEENALLNIRYNIEVDKTKRLEKTVENIMSSKSWKYTKIFRK